MRRIGALIALLALSYASVAFGIPARFQQQTISDGDSLSAAADTSVAVEVQSNTTVLHVVAWCDTVAIYTTQVSPDDGTTWMTIDTDTTAAGVVEATADFGSTYRGWKVRVIVDGLWSTGKKLGKTWINWTR